MKKVVKNKKVIIGLCLTALVVGSIGVTMALSHARTEKVYNEFAGAKVNISLVERDGDLETWQDANPEFKVNGAGNYDKHVKIKNLYTEEYPTTDTFVRARIVAVLRQEGDKERKQNMGAAAQIQDLGIVDTFSEYTGEGLAVAYLAGTSEDQAGKWVKNESDGYWYYTRALISTSEQDCDMTDELIQSVKVFGEVPKGTYVEIQVLADAIQARPEAGEGLQEKETPVYKAWNVYPPSLS